MRDIGNRGKTWSHFHLASRNWIDLPGGDQRLCYNEIATEHNWCQITSEAIMDAPELGSKDHRMAVRVKRKTSLDRCGAVPLT
jgi:hypothetical protein